MPDKCKVSTIVARIARTIAAKEASSADDCLIVDVMPRMVAIAPGPHMSGIASDTKAMLAFRSAPPAGITPPEVDGENSSADFHQDDAADDTDHAQWHAEQAQDQ
jgi:hypothetical protein